MQRREQVEIKLELHRETEKAILVSDDGDRDNAVWLPVSQITMRPVGDGEIVVVTMPEWLALDKGLI